MAIKWSIKILLTLFFHFHYNKQANQTRWGEFPIAPAAVASAPRELDADAGEGPSAGPRPKWVRPEQKDEVLVEPKVESAALKAWTFSSRSRVWISWTGTSGLLIQCLSLHQNRLFWLTCWTSFFLRWILGRRLSQPGQTQCLSQASWTPWWPSFPPCWIVGRRLMQPLML